MSDSILRQGGTELPFIRHIAPVAPDMLAVTVEAGRITGGNQIPYVKQPGDEIREEGGRVVHAFRLIRGGKAVGTVVRDLDGEKLWQDEKVIGESLNTEYADRVNSYGIISDDDPNYYSLTLPSAVYRKSKPVNACEPGLAFVVEHIIYLRLPHPLTVGKAYMLDLGGINVSTGSCRYCHEPDKTRSEAVHVSQIGYRPDDGIKRAFLSLWLGNGGCFEYKENLDFYLIDEDTGERIYKGQTVLAKKADDVQYVGNEMIYTNTDVYRMDFSDFSKPGKYRIYVDSIGCSYPFEIREEAWEKAFKIAMKGFYHNRSGIELGPPYTDYRRPRPYHPDDGKVVYHSTTSLMDSGNGLNAKGTDKDNFGNLVAGKTDRIVPDAWGAYFDAGDWDRRIPHLNSTRYQMELLGMFPGYFEKLDLNIPESGNGLPDVLNEALWNLDGYRRLQTEDGGIRGGIEAEEHPRLGECSWQDSLTAMSYAPDFWSSHIYAGVAARTAFWLKNRKPELARVYFESAVRAMIWAEDQYLRLKDFEKWTKDAEYSINLERNLAAIEMYRLTGEKRWHEIYKETRRRNQRDAAFVYAVLDDRLADPEEKQECLNELVEAADKAIEFARVNAFNLTTSDPERYLGPYSAFYGTPDAIPLVRAHFLTGKKQYLDAVVQACQFAGGANPINMTYTTGIGCNPPRNPLHHDSRRSGQKVPAGINIYGNFDPARHMDDWMLKLINQRGACEPKVENWPVVEAYFDVYIFPPQTEWTVHQSLAPNAYVWGYLAARR